IPCEQARVELEAHLASSRSRREAASRSSDRIVTTGIPVRAAFERVPALSLAGTRTLRVLVTSGGFGAAPMTRIVQSFAGVAHVELTVVCGASARLERRVTRAAAEVGVQARVLGFERDMPARMAE